MKNLGLSLVKHWDYSLEIEFVKGILTVMNSDLQKETGKKIKYNYISKYIQIEQVNIDKDLIANPTLLTEVGNVLGLLVGD